MAIITLTINPALDKSTYVDELIHTQKIYSDAPLFSAGGGGINVSRVLKRLGVDALAIMQASGPNGAHLKEMLNDEGIGFSAFETKGWTRENFVVNERSTQLQYRFDMPGPKMTTEELDRAFGMIQAKVSPNDYLVLSGSLPPSVPSVFYGEVCAWAKANQVKVVLDTKGEALKHCALRGSLPHWPIAAPERPRFPRCCAQRAAATAPRPAARRGWIRTSPLAHSPGRSR